MVESGSREEEAGEEHDVVVWMPLETMMTLAQVVLEGVRVCSSLAMAEWEVLAERPKAALADERPAVVVREEVELSMSMVRVPEVLEVQPEHVNVELPDCLM